MAIGRPQMEEQIKSFATAGAVDGTPDMTDIDKQLEVIREMTALVTAQNEARRSDPSQFLRQSGPPDPKLIKEYNDMLVKNFGTSRRSNIYDLASTLGGAMLSADPRTGAFRSLGQGFAQFGLEEKKRRQQQDIERRQLALKAFELAKSDQDAAIKLMNDYDIAIAKQNPENEWQNYYVIDPKGITVKGIFYDAGTFAPLTATEASGLRGRIQVGTGGGVKVPQVGSVARYMTEENAKKQIAALGLTSDMPNFDSAVARITAPSDSRIGKDVIMAGKYMELRPLVQDGIIIDVMLAPSSGSVQPGFEVTRNERLKLIAKNQDSYTEKLLQVVPTVERAMAQLMAGAETGAVTELTLGLRQLTNQLFGTSDPGLASIEDIVGISNYLAPKMRPVGSGSTSDMEFRAYQNAILALGKTPQANYISLYAFKKMTENGIRNNQLEQQLLSDSSINDMEVVNAELAKLDRGIFEKLPEDVDVNDEAAVNAWYASLPSGAVIDNATIKIFDGAGPFVIKDWGLMQ
ncbi:MAG: hypothetical protein CMF74_00255 [Maricaulis sp.]|nr:hypothetical protein [Maricaulis sp.]